MKVLWLRLVKLSGECLVFFQMFVVILGYSCVVDWYVLSYFF